MLHAKNSTLHTVIDLMSYVDPIIEVEVITTNLVINEPLILQCSATIIIVSDINSTVDIIWTTGNNTQVRRVNNVTAYDNINSTSTYNDSLTISSLDINDIGSVYQCEVLINSVSPSTAKTNLMIPIPGKYLKLVTDLHYIYVCVLYI